MLPRRFVTLDQDGPPEGGWLHVIVAAPTGVVHRQQYGGQACRQGRAEGFLVPVFDPAALDALRRLFEEEFAGAGTWNHSWPEDERARLRGIVGRVPYWTSDGQTDARHALELDEGRIHEADEAWVPVVTPDGPGLLVWSNSD
ncbi:DUF6210 family protein [Kitasatospora sp. NPDC127059]|uniref:DUF6210 family protein n=1 Tax=unclassified Kitasatospora TaxID=2633591 RepID=UPI00365BD9E2